MRPQTRRQALRPLLLLALAAPLPPDCSAALMVPALLRARGGTAPPAAAARRAAARLPRREVTSLSGSSSFRDEDGADRYGDLREMLSGGSGGAAEPPPSSAREMAGSLLGLAMERASASRAFSTTSGTPEDLISEAAGRASATLTDLRKAEEAGGAGGGEGKKDERVDKRMYLGDPCVTPTALAHSLWESTLEPGVDTAIDATCGNGQDSAVLAAMLLTKVTDGDGDEDDSPRSELLCVDIQSRACENTEAAVREAVGDGAFDRSVTTVATSHAPLPRPRDGRSVGLVCYNLGWLPGGSAEEKRDYQTNVESTLSSMADAALMLRVGGLLSVMTYPGSSVDEANAVKFFCEGMAMLTTRDKGGWRGYVDALPADLEQADGHTFRVRDLVLSCLERVVGEGQAKQTWRVFEHRPLGRPFSPVLVTAKRIK